MDAVCAKSMEVDEPQTVEKPKAEYTTPMKRLTARLMPKSIASWW